MTKSNSDEPSCSWNPQGVFRDLFHEVVEHDGSDLFSDVLEPWLTQNPAGAQWLIEFGRRSENSITPASMDELWALYAVSRVNEVLLRAFQPDTLNPPWPPPGIIMGEYLAFTARLGFTMVQPPAFCPFNHEIVEVTQAEDPEAGATLISTLWPCLMLGPMLFSRAGVHIRAGRNRIRKDLAEQSVLYWSYTRRNRQAQDLSHGWGSNSQWRTDFRRDYRFDHGIYLNVDAKHDVTYIDPPEADPNLLTVEERIELVTHRCFVSTESADPDPWPYEYSLSIVE